MSNTSTIHIKTDFDCKVYDYGQEIGTTKADTYFNIELRKGEHELTFVFTENESISKTINYTIEDADCDYRLNIEMAEVICDKAKKYNIFKHYSEAFTLYLLAARKGLARAQYNLGLCYKNGYRVKNFAKAVEWYTKAAEQGHAKAQCNLGYCYEYGEGVKKDLAKAVEWYTKAAEQGDADAQCHLGLCYGRGKGVEKDLAKAVEWFTKAAEQGHATAQCNLSYCYKKGNGVEKDLAKAVEWYTKAAEQGEATAQNNLGYCYHKGTGVKKDLAKAVEWYAKAAEQGEATAQCNLGYCYGHGEGAKKDLAKAVEWYTKAAEQGAATSQYNLGVCYKNGNGVEKDLAKAVEWYTKAAKQGDEDAQKALDRLKPNRTKCIEYLFFDTETTGIPKDYDAPVTDSTNWPRLVQLSWITTDEDCNILSKNDHIIYPKGFIIPADAARVHGITTSMAKKKGEPLEEILDKFEKDYDAAYFIVGHNVDFDIKIIRAELARLVKKDFVLLSTKVTLCTMEASTDYCKIPGYHGYKWPTLQELHKKLFGCEFEDAHNSMSDVTATLKCFKEMKKLGWI